VIGGVPEKLNQHPPRDLAETFPNSQQLAVLRTKVVKFAKAGQSPREPAKIVPPRQDGAAADTLAAQDVKPRTAGRTLEEIRRLPEGLRVTHSPNPVAAVMGKTKDHPFTWEFSTTVEALHPDLNIVEFGCFGLFNGNWGFSNAGGQPFSTQQFAEWYSCTDGILKPGWCSTPRGFPTAPR
jgi:hypothetical protein